MLLEKTPPSIITATRDKTIMPIVMWYISFLPSPADFALLGY
jgi:hypothetical protein